MKHPNRTCLRCGRVISHDWFAVHVAECELAHGNRRRYQLGCRCVTCLEAEKMRKTRTGRPYRMGS